MSDPIVNHKEVFDLACYKREESNLARCYLALNDFVSRISRMSLDDGINSQFTDTESLRLIIENSRSILKNHQKETNDALRSQIATRY